MEGLTGLLTRASLLRSSVFTFGFLDPRRAAWRQRGEGVGAWAARAGLRYAQEAVPAHQVAELAALSVSEAASAREAWHRSSGERDGLRFTLFDLRSKCRAVAGSRAPVDRHETLAAFVIPGAALPSFRLWVFSSARPGTPEAAAVTVARRWAGGVGDAAHDFVVDSCVATWRPERGALRDVVLESHPGLFLSGADPDALRSLFDDSVAGSLADLRGWRVEAEHDTLLVSCDDEHLPAGWIDARLPALVGAEHLDELLARASTIAQRIVRAARE